MFGKKFVTGIADTSTYYLNNTAIAVGHYNTLGTILKLVQNGAQITRLLKSREYSTCTYIYDHVYNVVLVHQRHIYSPCVERQGQSENA